VKPHPGMLSKPMNSDPISVEEQAEIFQLLSNSSRILIMKSLQSQEMSVGEIAEQIGATLQNTSQHLRLMKDKGFVEYRRDGQTVYYQLAKNLLSKKCKMILNVFSDQPQ
jgi:DNA-binding transcriptional ArsR family regulator